MKNLVILLFCVLLGCEPIADKSYTIRIRNNSNNTILVYGLYILPDTSIINQKPNLKTIASGASNEIYDSEVGDYKYGRLDKEKLTVFIFSKDTVDYYSWEAIRTKYKILKRYEINNQDLTNMGGTLNYP